MADFLLELFSEEIPARMQVQAAKDLERLIVGALSDRGLMFEAVKSFSGPRRLTLVIDGLPAKQPDVSEEKKGPRVGAPEKAIEGFLRSAGVTLEECQKQNDGKGEFYVAVIHRAGRPTSEVLAEIIPEAMGKLPWPKSMRWGVGGGVRWVRPLQRILAVFDGEIVPCAFAGVHASNLTQGHRFLSDGAPFGVKHFEDYEAGLRRAHVILDPDERKDIIRHELAQQAFALGLEPIADEGLLNEVAGLAEWPVVLIGAIEDQFMDVPAEILQTSMRTHQKYFSLRSAASHPSRRALSGAPQDEDPENGPHSASGAHNHSPHPEQPRSGVSKDEGVTLAPRFAVVSNMIAADGGKQIVAGNERVLRARLSDAKFFWDQDRKHTLASRVEALKNIVFHAKLGTQYERVERIEALAGEIAAKIGAGLAEGERNKLVEKAKRAARLCKADLTTGVVGEFPELQGVMGRYYAVHDGKDAEVADAIRDHYKPLGPSDAVPRSPVSIAVALADKLDQIAGFYSTSDMPTGSGDPYAVRRSALGVVRIALTGGVRLQLKDLFERLVGLHLGRQLYDEVPGEETTAEDLLTSQNMREWDFEKAPTLSLAADRLIAFLADRLKVALREKGTRHDLIDAVFSLGSEDDLVRLVARVEALQCFLKTDEGGNLLAGYKRAANILKAEEKKGPLPEGDVDPDALTLGEEKALYIELATAAELIRAEVAHERFVEAMGVMARLRGPVDAFFDKVTVNDPDAALRANRLKLLAHLRATLHLVADFSKIEG